MARIAWSPPVTEIPEHLLRRSKERRSALGLGGDGGGDAGGDAPAAAPAAGNPSTDVTPTATAAPAAAPAPLAAAAPPPPPPPAPYVLAAQSRRKIPFWAVPVLALLPVWGFVYAGSLAEPEEDLSDPVLVLGEEVYRNCAGCHGANGGGGAGRPLNEGDVLLTFPDIADQVEWVREGSALVGGAGNPYGSPDRPGGQRISGEGGYGQMPGFDLTEEELIAVSRYEREVLSGGPPEGEAAAGAQGAGEGGGEGSQEDPGAGGDAGDGGGSTGDGGAAANEDGSGEDTGSGDGGSGATDGGESGDGAEGDG